MEAISLNKWPIKEFTHRMGPSWYNQMGPREGALQAANFTASRKRSKVNEGPAVAPLIIGHLLMTPSSAEPEIPYRQKAETQKQLAC